MKTFSAQKIPADAPRQTAQGCLTANLAIPGLGSVIGGRKIGFVQMALCFSGLAISMFGGFRFIFWALAHWSEFHDPNADPLSNLRDLWNQARWPFLGILLFAIAWLWALLTSQILLTEAKKKMTEPSPDEKS